MNVLVSLLLAAVIQPLPAPEYADTEVSTNIPFAVSFDTMSRMNFSLSLDASPSEKRIKPEKRE